MRLPHVLQIVRVLAKNAEQAGAQKTQEGGEKRGSISSIAYSARKLFTPIFLRAGGFAGGRKSCGVSVGTANAVPGDACAEVAEDGGATSAKTRAEGRREEVTGRRTMSRKHAANLWGRAFSGLNSKQAASSANEVILIKHSTN